MALDIKKLLLIVSGIIISISSFSQDVIYNSNNTQKNTFFIEGFGNAVSGSLNYDRIITQEPKYKTSVRLGLLFIPSKQVTIFTIPLEYSYLKGSKNHYLEFSGGISFVSFTNKRIHAGYDTIHFIGRETTSMWALTGRIGYRFQSPRGGLFFKVGLTPFVPLRIRERGIFRHTTEYFPVTEYLPSPVIPWAGIGIGYTLKN